ncbi:hypothetical protein ACHAXR_003778, partial [Thalassiosira sp. AJA248-18]
IPNPPSITITELLPSNAANPPTRPHRTTASYTATASPTRKRPHPVKQPPAQKRATFPAENYGLPMELAPALRCPCQVLRPEVKAALLCGAHKSCNEHIDFLNEEFINMIKKGQWVILPAVMAVELEGIHLSLPGVVPQCDHRPLWLWICDYTWSGSNQDTLPLAAMEAM